MVKPRERKVPSSPRRKSSAATKPHVEGIERILVTGISGYWGSRLLLALEEDERIERIVAVDREPPRMPYRRAEIVTLSLENPLVADLLVNRGIQTIIHLQFADDQQGRERMFRNNVLGTRHLLAAAQQVGIRRMISRSSTFIYGASVDNPFYLPEKWKARARTRNPVIHDMVESERDFAEHWAAGTGPELTVLRFAPILGPTCSSQMTRYLRNPVLYSILGFDPLWQFTHEDDVLRAILHALEVKFQGAVNISGPGVLPVSKVASLLGRTRIPVAPPFLPWILKPLSLLPAFSYPSLPTDHLRHICLADCKKMTSEFGFQPQYTSEEAVLAFVQAACPERAGGPEFTLEYSEFARKALEEVLEPVGDSARP